MTDRMIDYYVKNLPFDARQEIHKALERINPRAVEKMLEKNEGYPSYRSMGYTEENIAHQLQIHIQRFQYVNDLMIKNNRPPLFDDPTDTYESSKRYIEITHRYGHPAFSAFGIRSRPKEELIRIMGCTWAEYVPEIYTEEVSREKQ